ncbi:hypothetical protein BDW71DRAFT_78188 [Aspergillus fruticulosus]
MFVLLEHPCNRFEDIMLADTRHLIDCGATVAEGTNDYSNTNSETPGLVRGVQAPCDEAAALKRKTYIAVVSIPKTPSEAFFGDQAPSLQSQCVSACPSGCAEKPVGNNTSSQSLLS